MSNPLPSSIRKLQGCRHRRLLGAVVMVGVAIAGDAAPAADLLKVSHQGVERTAIVHRPDRPPGPLPAVIALHGLGDTAENFRRWFRLDATADREGFVAVYPDAIERGWNYGRPIARAMPQVGGAPVDDTGYLRLLIDRLAADGTADPGRIYVAGHSRGGMMAFTLACALADRLAAVAAFVTGMSEYQREECRPARPVPLMTIAGTHDFVQSYDGWILEMGRLLSVPETTEFWRSVHGCTAQTGKMLPHRDMSDRTRVNVIEWSGCRSGARLVLYRVMNGGHQLPSIANPPSPSSEQRFGLRNRDVETADEVWAYFKQHVLSAGSAPSSPGRE
jgi:polyhydroxybutyrate depolymerase